MPEVFENIFHPHKNKKPVFLNSSYSDSIYEKLWLFLWWISMDGNNNNNNNFI